MKQILSRVLTFIIIVTAFSGLTLYNAAAAPRPSHIIINQVHGTGAATDGAVNYSFVELYNPTDSAVSLDAYSLQYFESASAQAAGWAALPLSGVIQAHSSFLIAATGVKSNGAAGNGYYAMENWDQEWTGMSFSNRSCSLALVTGATPLPATLAGADQSRLVDLVGFRNASSDPAPTYFEGAFVDNMSKQKTVRRVEFQDTDNNAADFEIIQYSTVGAAVIALKRPRWSGDGPWGDGSTDPGLPDHVIINQVYGSGPFDNSGAVSHSFIELYNPTDAPVSLAGWSLQMQNGATNNTTPPSAATGWERMTFNSSHVIAPKGYFLIRLGLAAPTAHCQIIHADMEWTVGRVMSNRAYSVALSRNTTLLSLNITAAQMNNVVDLFGALNDPAAGDQPVNYEGSPLVGISKQKSARRVGFLDTDNNAADFEIIDYRNGSISDTAWDLKGPRYSGGAASAKFAATPADQLLLFSHDAGLYQTPFDLSLSIADALNTIYTGAVIRYTLDGKDPTAVSAAYTAPISIVNRTNAPNYLSAITNITGEGAGYAPPWQSIDKGTVIKAQVFSAGGEPLTSIFTHSYFVGLSYPNLPVVSLVTDPGNFFDTYNGIYVNTKTYPNLNYEGNYNYFQTGSEWERSVHTEIFETDGTAVVSQNMGVRIHGNWARHLAQKSLRLYSSSSRDSNHPTLAYDIFQGRAVTAAGDPIEAFRRVFLRPSANENSNNSSQGRVTIFRDALAQRLFQGTNTGTQAARQCVVFLDGEFWGLYSIRERYDEYYCQSHYDLPDATNVGMLSFFWGCGNYPEEPRENPGDPAVLADYQAYMAMYNWFDANRDLSNPQLYDQALTFLDADSFIDSYISNMFSANTDWPGNNVDIWRYRTDSYPAVGAPNSYTDGRWRWMTKDHDWGFDSNTDMINWVWNLPGYADGNTPAWSVRIFKSLISNPTFRDKFINRYCDLLNTNLKPEVVRAAIEEMAGNFRPTIQKHLARWYAHEGGGSVTQWESSVSTMINFGNNRAASVRSHMRNSSGNYLGLSGAFDVTMTTTVNDAAMGYVRVNSIDILPSTPGVTNPALWSGIYFSGKTQTITANPSPGYMFTKFIVNGVDDLSNPLSVILTGNTTVLAVFEPDDGREYITITAQPAPNTTFTEGSVTGSLSVAAYARWGTAVSYQWYGNTVNANTGGTAIPGATASGYPIPSNLTEGLYYYYCVVSAAGADSVTSSVAAVRVRLPSVFEEGLPPNGAEIVLYAARNNMIVSYDRYADPENARTMIADQFRLTEANQISCTFTVYYYSLSENRVFLRANNGRNVTIEPESGGLLVRPRSVPPEGSYGNPDGWSNPILTLQSDGTFKIHRSSSVQGTYYVDVNADGALMSVLYPPGDSGKFNWTYAAITPPGVTVTGLVKTYNPNNSATVKLMQGNVEKYSTTIAATSGFGQSEQDFIFTGVAPGTYSLVIAKPGHTSFTVQTVTVGDTDVNLTQDSRDAVKVMTLLCGDINSDQMINDNDLIVLWQAANYNKSVEQAANPLCDLNGDGVINDNDLIILWLATNYNKGAVIIE